MDIRNQADIESLRDNIVAWFDVHSDVTEVAVSFNGEVVCFLSNDDGFVADYIDEQMKCAFGVLHFASLYVYLSRYFGKRVFQVNILGSMC